MPNSKESALSAENRTYPWRSIGVTPIFYSTVNGEHGALTETLSRWSEDCTAGKEKVVVSILNGRELPYDIKVNKMRWALADPNGRASLTFAEKNDPVPSVHEWLPVLEPFLKDFCDPMREHPAILHVPGRSLAPTTMHLASWLAKHANNTAVLQWFGNHGGTFARNVAEYWKARLYPTDPSEAVSYTHLTLPTILLV